MATGGPVYTDKILLVVDRVVENNTASEREARGLARGCAENQGGDAGGAEGGGGGEKKGGKAAAERKAILK